jgi:hypothetical protein
MPDFVKGLLTVLFSIGLSALTLYVLGSFFPNAAAGFALTGAIFGLLYGLEAGILTIYDLDRPLGWVQLLVDTTWSLPNTIFGFVLGNLIYLIKTGSTPSGASSRGAGWIVYQGSFGNVYQTLGTVNLGGAGDHERMHLLQARIFGPLYLVIFGANYVVNFLIQVLWTITLGALLAALKVRQSAYFRPPTTSAVQGFWGWIYYANVFELWAYSSHNP